MDLDGRRGRRLTDPDHVKKLGYQQRSFGCHRRKIDEHNVIHLTEGYHSREWMRPHRDLQVRACR